jgi:ABC-type amino acid transport substrate-binding protein
MTKFAFYFLLLCVVINAHSEQTFTIVSGSFPPYISTNQNEENWLGEITHAALLSQNIPNTLELTFWGRALKLVDKHQRDAVLGAYYSEERAKTFYFSRALAQTHAGFFKRSDSNISFDGSLESIKKHTICLGNGYYVSDEFHNDKNLIVTTSNDLKTCLQLLLNKRIELVAGTDEVGEYLRRHNPKITKKNNISFDYMRPNLAIHNLYLVVSKSDKDGITKLAALEKGLDTIIKNGELKRILTKHNFTSQQITDYVHFLKEQRL